MKIDRSFAEEPYKGLGQRLAEEHRKFQEQLEREGKIKKKKKRTMTAEEKAEFDVLKDKPGEKFNFLRRIGVEE